MREGVLRVVRGWHRRESASDIPSGLNGGYSDFSLSLSAGIATDNWLNVVVRCDSLPVERSSVGLLC
jgi:hypothetical protein